MRSGGRTELRGRECGKECWQACGQECDQECEQRSEGRSMSVFRKAGRSVIKNASREVRGGV